MVLISDAAKEIGLSAERLRQLINAGDVAGKKLGGRFYAMPRSEVDRLIREPRPKPGPKGPRKPRPSDYRYPEPAEHRTSSRLLRAAEDGT